ncbi:MAG: hypothetical protein ACK5JT_11220 [Hyphomicrobiaceae bacterium]
MQADVGEDAEFQQQGDLELVVMNHETLEVQTRMLLPDFLLGDAISVTGIAFDAAYYDVFGDGPAFGLRLSHAGQSRPNPFEQQLLWLFDYDPDGLRPILEKLIVAQRGGEWDMECAGRFYDISRVLDIAAERHNGAADIVVLPTEAHSENRMEGSECRTFDIPPEMPLQAVTLQYDGERYLVPDGLAGW